MKSQIEILENRRQQLLRGLATAQKAQFEADSKMQSRYDTQKEDAAQEVAIYQALIQGLDTVISRLKALDMQSTSSGVIQIGSRFSIEFDDGERDEFLLLDVQGGIDLGDCQILSSESPVGRAVLGTREGDSVCVELPSRKMLVRIVQVGEG